MKSSPQNPETTPEKPEVAALQSIKSPTDKKALQAFLGLANYFRDFVENFSWRVAKMSALQSKTVPFVWTPELENEFKDIKEAILKAPVLVSIDYGFPIADALSRCLVLTDEIRATIARYQNEVVGHLGCDRTLRLLKKEGGVGVYAC